MKGSVDLIALIIGSVVIIFILVLSGIFAQGQVNSDLYAETVYQEGRYQSMISTAQVLKPEVRDDIGMYPVVSGSDKQRIEQEVSENVSRVFGYQTENYLFQAGELEIRGESTGPRVRTRMLVASPSTEEVRVIAELGDGS